MIRNTAKVLSGALSLLPRSRAKLADKLLESLDQPRQRDIDNLWAEEVEDRIEAYEKGEIKLISGKEIFRKLRFKKRR